MDKFFAGLSIVVALFFGALGEYVCGRIILPAVGLIAPDYGTWFWFMFFGLLFTVPFYIAKEVLK